VAKYRVLIKASAAKELETLPKKDRAAIAKRITALGDDPRPSGCQKLSGDQKYSIRQGPYRILYVIEDEKIVVVVVKIGHRRDVYR
jgi:mRNA interferase RelE/StbE